VSKYHISPESKADLFEIWSFIARDSDAAADRVEFEFYETFRALATMPGMGHPRKDLTKKPALFFPMYSYLIVYRPNERAIEIVAVVSAYRNLKRLLKERR
jgi:plasmid stabilization system protein ParE